MTFSEYNIFIRLSIQLKRSRSRQVMLKAIIFDFDGVIADTEPVHLEAFKSILKDIDISLSDEDYYNKYLAYDDRTLFTEVLKLSDRGSDDVLIQDLIHRKKDLVTRVFNERVVLFPGFLSYLEKIKGRYLLAVGSGALKSEITLVLEKFGIEGDFHVITAADNVVNCKPDPEVFLTCLRSLNKISQGGILPEECLVFEDSISGIKAARSADMKCVAISNSYDERLLCEADVVVSGFEELNMRDIEVLFDR